ncbi:FAD-binding dehydrogenase [Sulfitobacter donghicola]|uniref:FAD-binding dehydrogenase n=1 Tax=Sulfitobacter donghicola DSW-25 = KCTC 12864 = JCM 14565 TaxID=1300350 RepID=A0A073IHE1_9RHOB|nr:FAD-binding dehydrogenase [Sulfitobacter donghicola]KEJ89753.1 FAD-binding dehydrogenase [Sulfitobacter donghicola DSW-25 = KCTC 12864 = JCM 14565]KIN67143.1 NAD binding site:Flavin-containing monooxygenase FMO [Sulfitobacter donghicola DSW-25 = KCTC 12864 = JCM 14565]
MGDFTADVIVVGAGLAGMTAAHEAVLRGRRVLLLDQEAPQSLGGQAFWSLGGLFMVDSPEQRRLGIKDSAELAWNDWQGSAQFDRVEDANPRAWAEKFIEFSAGEMRGWLHGLGMRWFPIVGWAERGGELAHGHGNSVPRFHITWGTGTGVVKPFADLMVRYASEGKLKLGFRHRANGLIVENGAVKGVTGDILEDSTALRGQSTSRTVVGGFEHRAESVIITTGGIGGNHDMVRKHWPERLGKAPKVMVAGVPDFVDGRMHGIAAQAGAGMINEDRMWHYCEGLKNYDPIWPNHGIRILPGPSSMWFDAKGDRMEAPYMPGFDTLGTLKRILSVGEHSWFILTQKIIEKEFALSGSEQNPDLTEGGWREVLSARMGKGATPAVEAFKEKGEDFIVADDLETLVARMNALTPDAPVELEHIRSQIRARDLQLNNKFNKDAQITAIHGARNYKGDKLIRTAKPHEILDSENGPLIAVRLNVITRKSLGGIHTDIQSRVLTPEGEVLQGLYAAGEACGFGGGGYHGYNALEGTFLGGCLFSGRIAGQNA